MHLYNSNFFCRMLWRMGLNLTLCLNSTLISILSSALITSSGSVLHPEEFLNWYPSRMVFENKAESSVIAIKKLLLRYLSLIDTCFLTLKIEVHARCFAYLLRAPKESSFFMENQSKELSVHNFSSFYRETFLLYESLRDAISPDKVSLLLLPNSKHYL